MISAKEAAEYLNISIVALERYINEGKLNVYYQPSPDDEVPLFDRAELAQLNRKGHIPQIEPTIDRDFELVSMPSTELISGLLPPFVELSEMALFDGQDLEYFSDRALILMPSTELMSGFSPPSTQSTRLRLRYANDKSLSILPTRDDNQSANNPLSMVQKELRTTKNAVDDRLEHQRVSLPSTGLVDVFLVLCARSVGNLISTLTYKNTSKIAPAMLKGKLLLNLDEAQILSGLNQTILMNAIKNHELPFQLISKTYHVKSKDLEQFVDRL
jgi:hypothetical protein